jgi:adenosine deaminase
LGAERIGHGVRCLEDPEIVAELVDRQVPLEVCPTSNVMTGVVTSIEEHPLPRLLEAGLNVTLNSDDPGMFASPVVGEYRKARQVFGFDDERLAALARAGVRASFADDDVKAAIERDIDAWLE